MTGSRLFALITLALAFVSCVAAMLVVPEVRCFVGLETSLHRECRSRQASAQGVAPGFAEGSGVSAAADERARVAAVVDGIRVRFQQIESNVEAGRLPSTRKEISGVRGDSAYATLYFSGDAVVKVRARIFENGSRTSYQAFYDGGQLYFMFRTVDRLLPSDSLRLEEQRYYFDGGRMVRWLSTPGGTHSPAEAEYVDAEQRIRALGATLLDGARTADAVIEF